MHGTGLCRYGGEAHASAEEGAGVGAGAGAVCGGGGERELRLRYHHAIYAALDKHVRADQHHQMKSLTVCCILCVSTVANTGSGPSGPVTTGCTLIPLTAEINNLYSSD
jgi:hypothetical protein